MKTYIFKIFEGYNHFKRKPLFQVIGVNNEYIGEWTTARSEAETELKELKN
jgi:hypothetical protein